MNFKTLQNNGIEHLCDQLREFNQKFFFNRYWIFLIADVEDNWIPYMVAQEAAPAQYHPVPVSFCFACGIDLRTLTVETVQASR